ncbi:hypothetical protein ACSBR2_017645 [Camellia fascicularis]
MMGLGDIRIIKHSNFNLDPKTALYTELWRACAGPLVIVPHEGERVFYFPQGHIEQDMIL